MAVKLLPQCTSVRLGEKVTLIKVLSLGQSDEHYHGTFLGIGFPSRQQDSRTIRGFGSDYCKIEKACNINKESSFDG